jgi:hypothetical protein
MLRIAITLNMDKSLITTGHQAQSSDNITDADKIRSRHEPDDDNDKAMKRRSPAKATTKAH